MRFSNCPDPRESTGFLFWQVSALWQRRVRQALQPCGLTHTQFVLLAVVEELAEQGGDVTQKRISELSRVDVMTVSSALRLLEKKGWITRAPNAADPRANAVAATEAGRTRLARAVQVVEAVDQAFFFPQPQENVRLRAALAALLAQNRD